MVMEKKLRWGSGRLDPKSCPDANQPRAPGMSPLSADYRCVLQGAGLGVTRKSGCWGQADVRLHPRSAPWTSYSDVSEPLFPHLSNLPCLSMNED